MIYKVRLERKARKKLSKIPEPYYFHLKTAILDLGNNPRPPGCFLHPWCKKRVFFRVGQIIHRKCIAACITDISCNHIINGTYYPITSAVVKVARVLLVRCHLFDFVVHVPVDFGKISVAGGFCKIADIIVNVSLRSGKLSGCAVRYCIIYPGELVGSGGDLDREYKLLILRSFLVLSEARVTNSR